MKLSKARAAEAADQGAFDFLCPFKGPLLRPDQVAKCLGRDVQHVYDLIDETKLESHAPTDRVKSRYMITRRSTLLCLAETANYDPSFYIERVEALLPSLNAEQLTRLIISATHRRARL